MKNKQTSAFKPSSIGASIIFFTALISGCASQQAQSIKMLADPDNQSLERTRVIAQLESRKLLDQQEMLLKELQQTAAVKVVQPTAPVYDPLEGKTISIAIAKGNISQILTAFSDLAKVNLVVEPAVVQQGALTDMFLKDVSLREAFNEVLKSYDVNGEIRNQTIRIKLHEEKFFSMNFLNINTQMSLSSGGNIFGSNNSSGNSAISGNLSMSAAAGARSDPYSEIENNLKAILGESRAQDAEPITTSAANQDPAQVRQRNQQQGFTLNRTSGTLFVKARPSQMRAIEQMIKQTQNMLTKQVYIEAQLIDVQLSDGYQLGVDWTVLRKNLAVNFGSEPIALSGGNSILPNGGAANPLASLTIPARLVGALVGQVAGGVGYQDKNGSAVINALRTFGNLRVLSNPNIQVRNGTPAMLSVGTSQRYVARSSSTQNNIGGGSSTTSSDVQTDAVFSGVMVGVLPMIREDGKIELLINPVQSEVDPKSLELVSINQSNRISLPQVAYKGITTTLNLNDGDVVVVGGLIDQKSSGVDSGLPYLTDIPLLGRLVGQERKSGSSRELIIVLRARLM